MLETLDYTIRIGSTPTFLYFDLYFFLCRRRLSHQQMRCRQRKKSLRAKKVLVENGLKGRVRAYPTGYPKSDLKNRFSSESSPPCLNRVGRLLGTRLHPNGVPSAPVPLKNDAQLLMCR